MSDVPLIIERVREALAAGNFGLRPRPARISVEPILNWGGFVNRSFRVSDGRSTFFLKLASDPTVKLGLDRWRSLATVLRDRYHAPPMLGWLEIEEPSFSGPLFDWIEGRMVVGMDGAIGGEVAGVIRRLHADLGLGRRLAEGVTGAQSCADAYLGSYHDRFVEDLVFIKADPPPFLDDARLDWMEGQADRLHTLVRGSAAFQEPAASPVHGDLWLNNTLVDGSGRWYLLDWDGLTLGDPVADWAMLFGPSRERLEPAEEATVLEHTTMSPDEKERLSVYAQASVLDWVIDPLADWVQAGLEPVHGSEVREANQRVHERALEAYQRLFGS